jgi:hypothetical protein
MDKCNFKDVEEFKSFIEFENMTDIEKDIALLDFECINTKFDNPNKYLEFKLKGFLKIAQKHNLNFEECFNNAIQNK